MKFELFQGIGGISRICTLVLGVIVLGMTAYFFNLSVKDEPTGITVIPTRCFFGKDTFRRSTFSGIYSVDTGLFAPLLAFAIITFIASLIWTVVYILDVLPPAITKTLDMIGHIAGGVLLFIGGLLWIAGELLLDRQRDLLRDEGNALCSKTQAAFLLIAGILGLFDFVAYVLVALFVWKSQTNAQS